jgi:nucleoside-diphosphate-sugar epimerase
MALTNGPRTILVTGGAGFIGSHIVEGLLERGDRVRVLDNLCTGKRENLENLGNGKWCVGRDFELIEADIRDADAVHHAVAGVDGVLHQAALGSVPRSVEDPMTTQQVNADGTLNVLLAARACGVKRVVYASSSSVYGDSETLPKREGTEGAVLSPYALTKQVNEAYGRLFWELYRTETIGLRYFNIYGPRQDPSSQYAAVIPRFVSALLGGDRPVIYGTGEQSRDFTFVRDAVAANFCALDAPLSSCGTAYNVGRGDRVNLLQLLETIQELLKTSISPDHTEPRPGDVPHSSADPTKAAEVLGFRARYDLHEGLKLSIDWYRTNL